MMYLYVGPSLILCENESGVMIMIKEQYIYRVLSEDSVLCGSFLQ